MSTISASVGRGGANHARDVRLIQELINRQLPIPLLPLEVDGKIGPATIGAIEEYQRRVAHMAHPDGRVDPGGKTLQALRGMPPTPTPAVVVTPATPFMDRVKAFIDHAKQHYGISIGVNSSTREPLWQQRMHVAHMIKFNSFAHQKPKKHKIIGGQVMDQGEAGRYRNIRVRVGPYSPPPPELVSGLTFELLEWWNKDSGSLTPVLSSAIVHYQFEAIHPFADGNGRTGRALALWELYRRGFDTHHIFSVDEYYWEGRPRYYAALQAVRQQNEDLTHWLEYTSEGLLLTLDRVWQRIQLLSARAKGKKLVLRSKQEQLLRLLREKGSLRPKEIWDGLGVSRQGAMDLLRPLMEARLVKREGTRKSGRYVLA